MVHQDVWNWAKLHVPNHFNKDARQIDFSFRKVLEKQSQIRVVLGWEKKSGLDKLLIDY